MRTIAQFGFGVWMFIAICLVSVIYAALFAVRGGARRFRVLCGLAAALLFSNAAAFCMGATLAAGGIAHSLARGQPAPPAQIFGGVGELFAGALMGFASLTLVAILVAVGFARGVSIKD